MIFYVLLTYGAKPAGPIQDEPAAKTQIQLFERVLALRPGVQGEYFGDYARNIDGLLALPKLNTTLVACRKADAGLIFIDDLARIFRITPVMRREVLLSELGNYGSHLFSLKHDKKLSNFSDDDISKLLLYAEKSKSPAQQARTGNTERARSASIISRANKSAEIGGKIKKLREELLATHGKATLQSVADRANGLGLRTSTGKEWTRQNIQRALDKEK